MITKRIHSQDAHYKLSPKNSGETSLNLSNEILQLIAPTLTRGSETPISFTLYRADYLKALGAIVNISPLYTSSSTSATEVKSDPSVFLKDFQAICVFFGSNDKNTYTVNINYRADGRIYLNSLEDAISKFNLRHFLVEEISILEFENANNEITIRLKTELDSFKENETEVKNELVREKSAASFLKTAMKTTLDIDNNFSGLERTGKYRVTKKNLIINGFWFGRDKNQPPTRVSDIYPDVSWSYKSVDYVLNVEITPKDMEGIFFPVYNYAYQKQLYMEKDLNGEYVLYEIIKSQRQVNSLNTYPLQQIFYGAPGTGKSFTIKECTQGDDTVIRTTFHPDSDYSTFVGCYKPTMGEPKPIYGFDATGKTVKVEDPKGTFVEERKIEYKFVQQAFTKAYVRAWKKMCDTNLWTKKTTAIPPAGKAATPYTRTGKIGDVKVFERDKDSVALLNNVEKNVLLNVDNFDFPFDGINNFGELHDKITVVVTNEPSDNQKERYKKTITLSAAQIRDLVRKYLENRNLYGFLESLLAKILEKLGWSWHPDLDKLKDYTGNDITIEVEDSYSLLGLYDPATKTVYLFKNNIGNDIMLLCATYIHEMFHAYYDSGDKYIPEIEEPIVECNTLCFLELFDETYMKSYIERVERKQRSDAINHYGFGAHLFENRSLNWMRLYQNAYNHIDDSSTIVNKYKKKFSPIYPFGNEEETRNLLYMILTGIKATASNGFSNADQFLIIEEINRGNCAQIFGDLFQLLDRKECYSEYPIEADDDLRMELENEFDGLKLGDDIIKKINDIFKENYPDGITDKILNGELLVLPENLYIWATMNTSDQSLFPIDSAFKRRWEWKYIPIGYKNKDWEIKIGEKENEKKYKWVDFQRKINDRIYSIDNSEDKQLGDFFVDANRTGKIISADTLLNKILFYIWNDVCKDDPDQIFRWIDYKDKKEKSIRFSDFFTDDKDKKLQGLMSFLDVKAEGETEEETEEVTPVVSTGAEKSDTDVVPEKVEGE